jgi:hypothetical protein
MAPREFLTASCRKIVMRKICALYMGLTCSLAAFAGYSNEVIADDALQTTVELQDLILIDYRERSGNPNETMPLPDYHQALIDYMKPVSMGGAGKAPPRFILYVACPCTGSDPNPRYSDFYDPNASCSAGGSVQTFVDFVKAMHDLVPGTELEILFDTGTVAAWSNACWSGPAGAAFPVPLDSAWTGLPAAMEWVRALSTNLTANCSIAPASNPIKGVTFDDEVSGGSQTVRKSVAMILGLDWFKHQPSNAVFSDLRIGMMPGIGEGGSTYPVLVSDFPINSWPECLQSIAYYCGDSVPCHDCVQANGKVTPAFVDFDQHLDPTRNRPSWRSSTDNDPLVQSCYIQVYSACPGTESFYQWANTGDCADPTAVFSAKAPTDAATYLHNSVTRVPWLQGPGTVQYAPTVPNKVDITGSSSPESTNFLRFDKGTRIYLQTSSGVLPALGVPLKFDTIASDVSATGSGCAAAPNDCAATASFPWIRTEISSYYASPPLPGDGNSRMFFMFSAEDSTDDTGNTPFFGNWTQTNFLDFVGKFYDLTVSSPIWAVGNDEGTPTKSVELGNFAIYDINFMCKNWNSMATDPPCIIPPPPPHCPADLNGDRYVDGSDLLVMLGNWDLKCSSDSKRCPGDLNDDRVVDAADLALMLESWDGCD